MPCTHTTLADGSRAVLCTRGTPTPPKPDPEAKPTPGDPWPLFAAVHHEKYGPGTITGRSGGLVHVQFDNGHVGAFAETLAGKRMKVVA